MGSPKLTSETEKRIALLFPEDQQDAVRALLLEECGHNLPFLQKLDPVGMDRFRFAALKLSHGNMHKLREAVNLAKTDWRDLLVAAGFANNVDAHVGWLPGPAFDNQASNTAV
jgi:hypothetical protein